MARQRRSIEEQIADLVTQGRTGRSQIMSTPAMAPVEAAMIADNAIQNEHLTEGSVTRGKMDAAFNELIDSLEGNGVELAEAAVRLGEAESRLDSVFGSVSDLSGQVTDASGKATAAQSAAAAAASAASTAQSKADAANTAAGTAQSRADAAATAAADAAGIAAGKGKVLVQGSAPGADDRNAQTLWIDTTGGANTPKRWTTGTTWVAVTDKAATDAASAAATAASAAATAKSAADTAQATANAAQTAAGAAQTTADSALTMAGSKSKVYYGTGNATGTASEGDTWRKVDGAGNVVAEWRWSSGWKSQQITSEVISNLDVGKLTSGTAVIDDAVVKNIAARTSQFIEADIGKLTVTGTTNLADAVARRIAANTGQFMELYANQVYIGQGGNLFTGTNMMDPAWQKTTGVTMSETGGKNGGGTLTIPATTAQTGSYFALNTADAAKRAILKPGQYEISAYAKPTAAAASGRIGLYLRLYRTDGTNIMLPVVSNDPIAAGAWGLVKGIVTVPEGDAVQAVLGLFTQSTLNTVVVFSNPAIRSAVDPTLVVDGTIISRHIDSNAITADKIASNAVNATHIEANSITAEHLRISGSNAIADPMFTDAKINAERLAGTTYAAGTMAFVADDESTANVLRFTEKSDTQRSFRVGGTSDYVPVTLGDRIRLSVKYRVQGTGLSGSSNIRFALYHDSATKSYIRYVGVGAYREIYDVGTTWLTWEADYTITNADVKFIRPMIQFRNNGWTGHMEIKDPRLEVASKLSVTAPVDTGGTTHEAAIAVPPGATMPGLVFTQSGPVGPPTGYAPATITSDNGATLNLYSGKPGGSVQGLQPSTVSIHNRGIDLDAGLNTGTLAISAGNGATINGQEVYYGGPSYRARVTLTNSFTHWTGSSWNGLWAEQIGKLTIISGAVGRSTAWPAGGVCASLPTRFRPPTKVAGTNCEVQADGALQLPAGSVATSFSITYFAA